MVRLRLVEVRIGLDARHDRARKHVSSVQLRDVGLAPMRPVAGSAQRSPRAVLRAAVRSLAVESQSGRGPPRNNTLQQLRETHLARIKLDAHRFGVPGIAFGYPLVLGGGAFTACIPGLGACHALQVLKHSLYAPEAAAGQYGGPLRKQWARAAAVRGCWWHEARFLGLPRAVRPGRRTARRPRRLAAPAPADGGAEQRGILLRGSWGTLKPKVNVVDPDTGVQEFESRRLRRRTGRPAQQLVKPLPS